MKLRAVCLALAASVALLSGCASYHAPIEPYEVLNVKKAPEDVYRDMLWGCDFALMMGDFDQKTGNFIIHYYIGAQHIGFKVTDIAYGKAVEGGTQVNVVSIMPYEVAEERVSRRAIRKVLTGSCQ